MSLALKLIVSPLLLAQAIGTHKRAPVLPEPQARARVNSAAVRRHGACRWPAIRRRPASAC